MTIKYNLGDEYMEISLLYNYFKISAYLVIYYKIIGIKNRSGLNSSVGLVDKNKT